MCTFLAFIETIGFGVVGLSFLVAWIRLISLVRTGEMTESF